VLTKGSGYNIPVTEEHDIFAKTGTTDGHTQTWTVGATTGIATASWFGSYKGFGPEWANENITINGKYYAGLDGANIAGTQWARLMNAAAPKYPGEPFPSPPAWMLR
jgi:membrane peptidoglycan carboxypeptidase